jgi:hypothetical protein
VEVAVRAQVESFRRPQNVVCLSCYLRFWLSLRTIFGAVLLLLWIMITSAF